MRTDEPMTRHGRFIAAVRREPVDRVPVVAWMHLASEHLPPEQVAQLHEAYWRAHDWDVLKVMADYRLEMPENLVKLDTPERLRLLQSIIERSTWLERQRECLAALMQRVGSEVPVIESGYDPYTWLLRHMGHDQAEHLWRYPDETQAVLKTLTDALCTHLQHIRALGVSGYFHATWAAVPDDQARGLCQAVFEAFVQPYDKQIMAAAKGLVRVLHAHGSDLQMERLKGYPFEVLHLADRTPGNPSLLELRRWTSKCLMGGVDERQFTALSVPALVRQIEDAVGQVGREGFILAPGCSVPPSSANRLLGTMRRAAALNVSNVSPKLENDV